MKRISVIIPLHNAENYIERVIAGLYPQLSDSDEVIFVENKSSDKSVQVVLNAISQLDTEKIKLIECEKSGRAIARNFGVKHSAGEYLFFLDADTVPENNCLNLHFETIRRNSEIISTGLIQEYIDEASSDFQKYVHELIQKWNLGDYFTTANLSMAKSIFNQLGGFDENLTDNEDYDFKLKAEAKGILIQTNKEAVGIHLEIRNLDQYIQRQVEYSKSFIRWGKLNNKNSLKISSFTRLKHVPFQFEFWKVLIKNEIWPIMLIPEKLRFKLYSAVIWANVYKEIE